MEAPEDGEEGVPIDQDVLYYEPGWNTFMNMCFSSMSQVETHKLSPWTLSLSLWMFMERVAFASLCQASKSPTQPIHADADADEEHAAQFGADADADEEDNDSDDEKDDWKVFFLVTLLLQFEFFLNPLWFKSKFK